MTYAVVKGAGYILANAPDMVMEKGATAVTERVVNPDSEFLVEAPKHLRNFDEFVNYAPNQVYIGNLRPEDLNNYEMPWYDKDVENAQKEGKFGSMLSQDEFYALMKICDVFDLVLLETSFVNEMKEKLAKNELISDEMIAKIGEGVDLATIEKFVEEHAETIIQDGKLVGCVKKAHDVDPNLNAHVMFENLVVKASGVYALMTLLQKNEIDANDIDYVIECSEEACGDVLQRGGGNFAKSIAEMAGCQNATGSDTRAFCAAPTHSLIEAAALVQSGVYDNVVVVAGGCTAKLGMNGKDHVKKGLPILEDAIGGFAILVSKNDGVNPVLRTDLVGRHTVGTGSSPQAVITSLIQKPLEKGDLKITDIDKYSVEMQNPDITKPAGAGDVPASNYKMIGALGVMRKEMERSQLATFGAEHGMPGWAPTQGHIPSGVPYLGFAREDLSTGELNRAMIVGKGSLFLGRMTNLFDGVSIIVERNNGVVEDNSGVSQDVIKKMIAEAMRGFAAQLNE
jgi:hypothetical protein